MCELCHMARSSWDRWAVESLDPALPPDKVRIIKLYWLSGAIEILEQMQKFAMDPRVTPDRSHLVAGLGVGLKDLKIAFHENAQWLHAHARPEAPPTGPKS